MKPSGFHDGDRSEYLAAFAFDTIGYSVPVPRQEDRFLVDLLVHLARRDDQERLVPQGIVFCVQVKSDKSPIGIRAEHVEWLNKFMAPLYISVVDKTKQILEIFHTMRRIEAAHRPSGNALALCMQDELPATISIGNRTFDCDAVPLGKPIARIELPALDAENPSIKKARRHEFSQLMLGWPRTGARDLEPGLPAVKWSGEVPGDGREVRGTAGHDVRRALRRSAGKAGSHCLNNEVAELAHGCIRTAILFHRAGQ